MQKNVGRRAAYPSTIPQPEEADHIRPKKPGPARELAIEEYREVQILRTAIRQRLEDHGVGALTALAEESGVTVAWLTRLLRWKENSATLSERPPRSVSFAKIRRVAEAAGVNPRAIIQRLLPETLDEFFERTGGDVVDPLEQRLVALWWQLDVEQRRRTVWQLRGLVQRVPSRGEASCAFCGSRIPAAGVDRLQGVCLECVGSQTGVMPLSYIGADREEDQDGK